MNNKITERPKGISAFIIINGSKDWLGQSIESIIPLFDELLVTSMIKDDETNKILNRFTTHKLRKIEKPVNTDNCPKNEVYEECKKWIILNSKYSHICEWDANMLLLQDFVSDEIYKKILECKLLKFNGYNITSKNLNKISKEKPYTKMRIRAYKIIDDAVLKKQDTIVNTIKAKKIEEPIYIDTKEIQNKKNGEALDLKLPNFFFKKKEDYLK